MQSSPASPDRTDRLTARTLKDMTMSTFINAALRDLICVAAATVITLVVGMAFVQSTKTAPGAAHPVARVTVAAPLYT
jgi:hypothetical protein